MKGPIMKHVVPGLCALVLFAFTALPCVAESNPWNGSWKVDPGSYHYEGMTYTWVTSATGFKVMMGDQEVSTVTCDGKAEARPSGVEATCVKVPGGYTVTNKRDGKVLSVVKLKVSEGARSWSASRR